MKTEIIRSNQRGESNIGWLHSRFSFSFAGYHDPNRMGFGMLRVLNDDIVQPGRGFGEHPHKNMEIISIPTQGSLAHKDSTGTEEEIVPGQIQVMSAGSGITHSEYNYSDTQEVKFFQIWIHPNKQDIQPRHDKIQIQYKDNELSHIVGPQTKQGTIGIQQDAHMYIGKFSQATEVRHKVGQGNGLFVFVIEGELSVDSEVLQRRDTAQIQDASEVTLNIGANAHVLLIEVPMQEAR